MTEGREGRDGETYPYGVNWSGFSLDLIASATEPCQPLHSDHYYPREWEVRRGGGGDERQTNECNELLVSYFYYGIFM